MEDLDEKWWSESSFLRNILLLCQFQHSFQVCTHRIHPEGEGRGDWFSLPRWLWRWLCLLVSVFHVDQQSVWPTRTVCQHNTVESETQSRTCSLGCHCPKNLSCRQRGQLRSVYRLCFFSPLLTTQCFSVSSLWLRSHHRGRGLCEQIKPSQRTLARGLGSAHKTQDQGDGSYSNTRSRSRCCHFELLTLSPVNLKLVPFSEYFMKLSEKFTRCV